MFPALAVFFFGIAVLLAAAEVLVRAAIELSGKLKISPLIVGTTIVALGTSLPETAVSLTSVFWGDSGLAVGNIVGSNVINVFLVLGLAILVGGLRIGTTKTPRNAIIMAAAAILFSFFYIRFLSPVIGIILLCLAGGFTGLEYLWGQRGRKHEDKNNLRHPRKVTNLRLTVELALSLVGVVIGGIITVSASKSLAVFFGVSTTIIGLSLTAAATSLPELLVSVVSELKKQPKLAIGNVIGSNIYNLLFIGGLIAFFSPKTIVSPIHWFFLLTASFVVPVMVLSFRGRVVPRWVGIVMLAAFLFYLQSLV